MIRQSRGSSVGRRVVSANPVASVGTTALSAAPLAVSPVASVGTTALYTQRPSAAMAVGPTVSAVIPPTGPSLSAVPASGPTTSFAIATAMPSSSRGVTSSLGPGSTVASVTARSSGAAAAPVPARIISTGSSPVAAAVAPSALVPAARGVSQNESRPLAEDRIRRVPAVMKGEAVKAGAAPISKQPAVEGPLMKAFVEGLSSLSCDERTAALKFVDDHRENVARVMNLFSTDGKLQGGPLPAACYNDFYKWTMFPVVAAVEKAYAGGPANAGGVRCTFSVNIRDEGYRKKIYESAIGKASPALFDELKASLYSLQERPFDRAMYERCVADYKIPGWTPELLDSVCGTDAKPRMLVQEFRAVGGPSEPEVAGNVLVEIFVAHDEKLHEDRVYVEATGPWHRVTWLETSMMQAVYDVLLRDRKREEYGEKQDSVWYPKWLAEAFCRGIRSVAAAEESGLAGALFTGRRTGGLVLMMLQGLYTQQTFKKFLGSSSVTSAYMSLAAGVPPECVPKCAGTHAHELSMVIGAILGDVDDKAGMPLSQIIGHMLYFYTSRPQGDVREPARKPLMPMLTDTLGSRAFMKTAAMLKVPAGLHKGEPVLSVIGAARQDSGSLKGFAEIMAEFNFTGGFMASEIETAADLMSARDNGYKTFGAGGFMGDSEKAWDSSKINISMACKVLRVYVAGQQCPPQFTPVKTGETSDSGAIKEGKFEADGLLTPENMAALKVRAQVMADANPKLSADALQELFEETMSKFGDSASASSSCTIC